MSGLILVVATAAEAQYFTAVATQYACPVVVSGIGAVNAALATQMAILQHQPSYVLHTGIAGAYLQSDLALGQAMLITAATYADLGAYDQDTFISAADMGFGVLPVYPRYLPAAANTAELADSLNLASGLALTVEAATGSLARAELLQQRYPEAYIEDMESAGVLHAALQAGVPVIAWRGVSNWVGPRDRKSWCIAEALLACQDVLHKILKRLC
jgi:futalosine hydrolase